MKLETYIKDIPNFPKDGIIFKDVAPLLASPKAFQATIDLMASYLDEIDVVISPDARGFYLEQLLLIKQLNHLLWFVSLVNYQVKLYLKATN